MEKGFEYVCACAWLWIFAFKFSTVSILLFYPSYLFFVMCVFLERDFDAFIHSILQSIFTTIQAAIAAFNGHKSHFESQTGFYKTDKRQREKSQRAHTHHIWLGLESAIRHWKTLTTDCASLCVCGNGRSLFSTTITNAFILSYEEKNKNVHTYHHLCLQMDSLLVFSFFLSLSASFNR